MRKNHKNNKNNKNNSANSKAVNKRVHSTQDYAPSVSTAFFRRTVTCSIPRGLQMFPDVLNTWSKTIIDVSMGSTASSQNSFHLNSPAKLFGPQVNWTGAFTDNVPAGISYLLSSNSAAGSTAPYLFAMTDLIDYEVEFINSNNVPAYVTVIVSIESSFSGMSQSQLAEQRGAVQKLIPASQAIIPPLIKGRYSVAEVVGVSRQEVISNNNFRQPAGSIPSIPIYLHFIVASTDGTTAVVMNVKHKFEFHTRFTQINNFVTTVPS